MIRFYVSRRIVIGLLLILGLLSWLAVLFYLNSKKMMESSRRVAHTHDVLYQAEKVLAVAVNIEIGQRGFALTGYEAFLEPYNKSIKEIREDINTLFLLTGDNPQQQKRLENLQRHIAELLDFSAFAVAARRRSLDDAIKVNGSMNGKKTMDSIRRVIADFEAHENLLLKERVAASDTHIGNFNTGFIGLLFVTGVILIGVFYTINDNMKTRAMSANKLKTVYDEIQDLYDNAPCGYHSLNADGYFENVNATLANWLGYKREDMIGKMKLIDVIVPEDIAVFERNYPVFIETGAITDVEFTFQKSTGATMPVILSAVAIYDENGKYIKSRSTTFDNTARKMAETRIKNLNKELEAFSYSVSHDLRAPLRSIDGYSRILSEDYAEKLDDEGKRLISVIINNAKRMGHLIDDLLDFSRLGRKDVNYMQVDMTHMAGVVARELKENEPGRDIEIVIHPLAPSVVDTEMIKQVWQNLISNAIKYTGKTPKARIEIDSTLRGDEVIYCVKDNGVGFDMQYVDKLFGVFQRLHKMQEFSGTGVGLAIVHRIISRHGGRVWADAKVNQGATFYFSIPQNHAK